jgi:hypothetical protein
MQFKKQISLFLAFFLLVSNLGLAFNVHYCENEIASISLSTVSSTQNAEDDCCGVVEKQSKCCNDKIIKAEIKADQIIVKSLSFDVEYLAANNDWKPLLFVSKNNFKKSDSITYYCNANAPPLYLMYSQYTFYS